MTDSDTSTKHGQLTSTFRLVAKPDEIAHLVCCRAVPWGRAFCGAEGSEINLAATIACTMCIEQAEAMLPGCLVNEPTLCPVNGDPCPDEHEIDLRIARETE